MQPPPPQIFRFDKRCYLEKIQNGCVRFSHARTFKNTNLTTAQCDDEQVRFFSVLNFYYRYSKLEIIGRTSQPLDYYILCFSLEYDPSLHEDFGADACLLITDTKTFFDRLMDACRRRFPGCDFYAHDVFYYDPTKPSPSVENRDLVFMKPAFLKYTKQKEFRLVFAIDPNLSTENHIFIEAGSMNDITKFYSYKTAGS